MAAGPSLTLSVPTAARPALAKALFEYVLYHDHNPRKALELAALATVAANYEDWSWKERLGKCYYMLGLYREAEKQFASSIKTQPMVRRTLSLRLSLSLSLSLRLRLSGSASASGSGSGPGSGSGSGSGLGSGQG